MSESQFILEIITQVRKMILQIIQPYSWQMWYVLIFSLTWIIFNFKAENSERFAFSRE